MDDTRLVAVGRILKAHGLRGELKMEPISNVADRFKKLGNIVIEFSDGITEEYAVENLKTAGRIFRLKLEGIDDRNAAERFRGTYVLICLNDVAPLDDNTYYAFDLEGLTAFDPAGKEIGTVIRIETYPANDILVIGSENGEIIMPAVKEFILDIDLEQKRMTVDFREGLPFIPGSGAAR